MIAAGTTFILVIGFASLIWAVFTAATAVDTWGSRKKRLLWSAAGLVLLTALCFATVAFINTEPI